MPALWQVSSVLIAGRKADLETADSTCETRFSSLSLCRGSEAHKDCELRIDLEVEKGRQHPEHPTQQEYAPSCRQARATRINDWTFSGWVTLLSAFERLVLVPASTLTK